MRTCEVGSGLLPVSHEVEDTACEYTLAAGASEMLGRLLGAGIAAGKRTAGPISSRTWSRRAFYLDSGVWQQSIVKSITLTLNLDPLPTPRPTTPVSNDVLRMTSILRRQVAGSRARVCLEVGRIMFRLLLNSERAAQICHDLTKTQKPPRSTFMANMQPFFRVHVNRVRGRMTRVSARRYHGSTVIGAASG